MSNISEKLEFLYAEFNEVSYIKPIKSGKEADVHLVLADANLFALKVYKEHQKFASRKEYINVNEIGDSRKIRAIKNKSVKGTQFISQSWTSREVSIMKQVYDAGGDVPQIFMCNESSILMEFIGVGNKPALRLVDTNLSNFEYLKIFDEIVQNILIFLDLGFVHGDLNEFNILYKTGKISVIDFPQIVWLKNQNSYAIFQKDLQTIQRFFKLKISQQHLEATIKDLNSEFRKFTYRD